MKRAGMALSVGVMWLAGCGGGSAPEEISTTTITEGKSPNTQAGGNTNAPPPALTDINTLRYVKVTNVTSVVTSEGTYLATNQVRVYYKDKAHFDKKEPFTGLTTMTATNGATASIPIKDGKWHGTCKFTYPSGKPKYQVSYQDGLKSGWSYGVYETGKRRSRTYYTNSFRAGPWFSFHPNGMTNAVVVYSSKKPGTILRRAAFDPNGKPLVGRTYAWEFGGTNPSKQITGYRGKQAQVLIGVFGDPDRRTGNLWVYNKLRIKDMPARMIRRTAQFTVVDNVVTAVEVLP